MINSPDDLKRLGWPQLDQLAAEIREELVDTVSMTGGHLAPNLGVVELTLALHLVFDAPRDPIVWDVGHQSYVHKLVTGRGREFKKLRTFGGLSGFPSPAESEHDHFTVGHASTSISTALGLALARDLAGEEHAVVAVIGDGAMTGGMAFEAMNHAGHQRSNLVVVLNDNEMSIARNVGALSGYLGRLRTDPKYTHGKDELEVLLKRIPAIGPAVLRWADRLKDSLKYLLVPGMFFEELGFMYLGPVDGHNLQSVVEVLRRAKGLSGPVLVHVCTRKGKGYAPAEKDPDKFHGPGPFHRDSGEPKAMTGPPTYTAVFGRTMVELAAHDPRIVAITAAMPSGTGLAEFAQAYPDRFFDVGIAEAHAVTLAAGLARGGKRPVVAVYSTFLQRAFDSVMHDVCLNRLPVILCIDRAGIVGEDGPTHHGLFDLSFLRALPGLTIMVPADEEELRHMLKTALRLPGPAAIRYPRGTACGASADAEPRLLEVGRARLLQQGSHLTLAALGTMLGPALEAASLLSEDGVAADVLDARFVKPLDEKTILGRASATGCLITVEEHALAGGFGGAVLEALAARQMNVKFLRLGIPDRFVEYGSQALLREKYGLTGPGIADAARDLLQVRTRRPRLRMVRE
ncbi:MAG: 1-deoxy-D-xylulose-5-phosphate synthase [Peptococcaceae bacterium]|jgi:1-deoxy-D-xylulose-5-phosphate synthase|nr:1-deoxy-D-xylulose-5-phosphate synthase [Peptococcaceae bacterium]